MISAAADIKLPIHTSPDPASAAVREAAGDTLQIFGHPFPHAPRTYRPATQADPAQVFGEGSQLYAATVRPAPDREPFSTGPVYQYCVLAVAIAYCLLAYYHRGSLVALAKMVRGKLYTASLLEQASRSFTAFMRYATAMVILAGSITVVRLVETLFPAAAAALPAWAVQCAVPLTAAVLSLGMAYRYLLLRVAGGLTFTRGFTGALWDVRRMSMALGTLAVVPLLLLLVLGGGTQIAVPVCLLLLWTAVLGFVQYKAYMLFVMQNVSILQWILYL
ncbi:MAG: hypothetical protein LBU95_03355 [Rikenellaceae bacterium]|jgi:hypothetical protein|nr:hypothetical protein [Rikenellaceae bacterium]